jgi:hypothetical protein
MTSGFTTWKDVLDVVAVPIALAVFPIIWTFIQSWYRCRRFRLLAGRELEEIAPFPETVTDQSEWKHHLGKTFLHQHVITEISENRDFVLGLDPDFVYSVSQLWKSYDTGDADQWLWYLEKLAHHRYLRKRKQTLLMIQNEWRALLRCYGRK